MKSRWTGSRISVSLVVTVLLSSGCVGEIVEPGPDEISEGIYNGDYAVRSNYASTVFIEMTTAGMYCGGVLVAPRVVATAYHCLRHGPTRVRFPRQSIRVMPARSAPRGANDSYRDLALLLLESAPRGIDPVTVRSARIRPRELVNLVGFGLNDKGANHTLLEGSNLVHLQTDDTFSIRGALAGSRDEEHATLCFGDSGSPAFDDRGQLIGIASRIDVIDDDASHAVNCQLISKFTSVPPLERWIALASAALTTMDPAAVEEVRDCPWGHDECALSVSGGPRVENLIAEKTEVVDLDGDGCMDQVTWTPGCTSCFPRQYEKLEISMCGVRVAPEYPRGAGAMIRYQADGDAGTELLFVHHDGSYSVLDSSRGLVNLRSPRLPRSARPRAGGSFANIRAFADTDGTPGDEVVVQTGGGFYIASFADEEVRPVDGSGNLHRLHDLDGQPGQELIFQHGNNLQLSNDRTGASVIVPVGSNFTIVGISDLDGRAGAELAIQHHFIDKLTIIAANGAKSEHTLPGFDVVNGLYDTDGQPGAEVVAIDSPTGGQRYGTIYIVDHRERYFRRRSFTGGLTRAIVHRQMDSHPGQEIEYRTRYGTFIYYDRTGDVVNQDAAAPPAPAPPAPAPPAPTGARVSTGNLRGGVACWDEAEGEGYLMYSAVSVHDRFEGVYQHSANNFICVKPQGSGWVYDTNGRYEGFDTAPDDLIVATINFDSDTINSLHGQRTMVGCLAAGFSGNTLTFTPDLWAGSFNDGEFGVTGTHFTRHSGHNSRVCPAPTVAPAPAPAPARVCPPVGSKLNASCEPIRRRCDVPNTVPLYEWYSARSTDHYYTLNSGPAVTGFETFDIVACIWTDGRTGAPLHQWYSTTYTDHYFSTNAYQTMPPEYGKERTSAARIRTTHAVGTVPLYRLAFRNGSGDVDHMLTTNRARYNAVRAMSHWYEEEPSLQVAGYVVPPS